MALLHQQLITRDRPLVRNADLTRTALFLATALTWPVTNVAFAKTLFPATLAGHALIPAMTLIAPPADAPKDAMISGKFAGPARNDVAGSVMGDTGASHGKQVTSISQPFQGRSGFAMNRAEGCAIFALTDNGFGTKANSPDALLFFHRLVPDFGAGTVAVQVTSFLSDPDRKVPFRLAYEGADARYLTGADFDIESIQITGGTVWLGDEFGPYIINTSMEGRVIALYPTMVGETQLKGQDTPGISALSVAGTDGTVQRSDGWNRAATATARNLTGEMTIPFFTIEDVMMVDATHMMVANDNNLPYSSGRALDKAADNEFFLLSVPELLAAK